jgi:hypothetical protein
LLLPAHHDETSSVTNKDGWPRLWFETWATHRLFNNVLRAGSECELGEVQAQLHRLGPQQRNNPLVVGRGPMETLLTQARSDLELKDFKQFLDQLLVTIGCDDRIHTIAELHQADPTLVIHRQANNPFQGRSPRVVQGDLNVWRNKFAVTRNRQLQLNPSPEESTSSRTEPPLETKHSGLHGWRYNYWVTNGGIKVLQSGNGLSLAMGGSYFRLPFLISELAESSGACIQQRSKCFSIHYGLRTRLESQILR